MSAAIEVRGLHKRYGDREAVRGVDLHVAVGAVFCLLGPNGAGKTTTVEIMEGFRSRSAGEVRVLGVDPDGQPVVLRQRVGIVLQECALPGELRVAELIDAYRSYYPHPLPLDQLLAIVAMESDAHTMVRDLSGGQQRRVDLALALAGDPELVFLDEPTTGFDPAARRRTWEAIKNLAALGKTVVLTTHYLDEAQELADRVAVIVDGRVVACDTPQRLADIEPAPSRVSFHLPAGLSSANLPVTHDAVVVQRGDRVTITTSDTERQLKELLAWASRHDAHVGGLAVSPPTLEDVYLRLVGVAESDAA